MVLLATVETVPWLLAALFFGEEKEDSSIISSCLLFSSEYSIGLAVTLNSYVCCDDLVSVGAEDDMISSSAVNAFDFRRRGRADLTFFIFLANPIVITQGPKGCTSAIS